MKKVLVLALTMLLIAPATVVGQSKGENEAFNTAKLHLANRRVSDAQPILEKLVAADPENANLNYLLGLCYVQQDINQDEAVRLLEKASKRYTKDYDAGSATERNAPEYVYYYLLIAYSQAGNCSQSLATLNKFYSIYSYEDEYYLVDGQKWVRECNIRKKEEEEKQRQQQEEPPALAAAEPAPQQAATPDPEPA
ncbi:MAG: tetratricopeptide repeat protein, partial [Bacteroidota bacterium]